jgi:hypothetical protein
VRRRRALIYAALALAVPLPALALTGGSESGLSVSASLQRCGVGGSGVMCEIGASFGGVDGAEYYTATVTAPDGTVTDYGQVAGAGAGSTSVWVPYVGSGTYTVTVTAWGYDDRGHKEELETKEAGAEGGSGRVREGHGSPVDEAGEYSLPSESPEEPPAAELQPVPDTPVCDSVEVPPPPPPASDGTEPPTESDPTATTTTEAALSTEAAPTTEATDPNCPPAGQAAPSPAP